MTPKDVQECAEIIATHPTIGPRYGHRSGDLCTAWLRLLRDERMTATVMLEDGRRPICLVGVSVFVSDDFVRELKAPREFWIGPELAKRVVRGDAPILSNRELRDANSRGGLNLVVWEGCVRPGYETHGEIPRHLMDGFIEAHRGFLLKEAINTEIDSPERLRFTLETGGQLWNPLTARYEESFTGDPNEVLSKPHVIGVTREIEAARSSAWGLSWVGALFDYCPPRCGFSRGEQRMLLRALEGETDRELSQALGVSVPAVKKMWASVYRRVADHLPELSLDQSQVDASAKRRGKEKKRHLLAYLRQHPEELRPVNLKLLGK